jgi:hypothetical protein
VASDDISASSMEAYCAQLLPTQQHAIATAQLAGCRFEQRTYERDLGWVPGRKRAEQLVTTSEYEVFLPDGTSAGIGEDIYECALIALSILDTPPTRPSAQESSTLFKLDPENEQQ